MTTDVNFLELVNISDAPLTLSFANTPEGLTYDREHVSPKNAQRTADGTLVVQTVPHTKKNFEIQGSFSDRDIHTYLQALREGNDTATLTLYFQDAAFADQPDFTGTVNLVAYSDTKNQAGNAWSFTASFMEV